METEWVELEKQDNEDDRLTRFVSSFAIDIPFLRSRIARGDGTLEEFVDGLIPSVRETITDCVRKKVEGADSE